jgi:SAM-dependent methyltransferase
MTDTTAADPPSAFVVEWARRMLADLPARPRALDVAMGRGRHALALARMGCRVAGIDTRFDAVYAAHARAQALGLRLDAVCADLTMSPLPVGRFDLIVVTRYLDRALFPSLRRALRPSGVLLYETFTDNQLRYARGPRSRAHLLYPGELRMLVSGMNVLFDEELTAPDAVARIVARARTECGPQGPPW